MSISRKRERILATKNGRPGTRERQFRKKERTSEQVACETAGRKSVGKKREKRLRTFTQE